MQRVGREIGDGVPVKVCATFHKLTQMLACRLSANRLQITREFAASVSKVSGNAIWFLTTYGVKAYSRNVEANDNLADARTDQTPTDRCQAQGFEIRAIDSALRGHWID